MSEECCEKSENDEYWCPNCDSYRSQDEVYAGENGDVAGCTACIGDFTQNGDSSGD